MELDLQVYADDGCSVHPACLTCPLPRCRYDNPEGSIGVSWRVKEQAAASFVEIRRMRKLGLSIPEIATAMDISTRTVHRATAKA